MNRTLNHVSALLISSALALASSHVSAQAPAQKKDPAASAKTKARTTGTDKLMTLEELRVCMKLQDSNNALTLEIEQRNEQNSKERLDLLNAPDSAQMTRAEVDAQLEAVKQADVAVREHGKAVEEWNEKAAEFEKKAKDMRNERQRRAVLKQERIDLKKIDDKLIADRTEKIALYERSVTQANEKITQRAKLNEAWNKRNEQLADDRDKLLESRARYMAECASRRFLEDDEKLIKAGK